MIDDDGGAARHHIISSAAPDMLGGRFGDSVIEVSVTAVIDNRDSIMQ